MCAMTQKKQILNPVHLTVSGFKDLCIDFIGSDTFLLIGTLSSF